MGKGKRVIYKECVIIEGGLHIHLGGEGQRGDPLLEALRSIQGLAGPMMMVTLDADLDPQVEERVGHLPATVAVA